MEKESITIIIDANSSSGYNFKDRRVITVQGTRGDIAKKLDEIRTDIEETFET